MAEETGDVDAGEGITVRFGADNSAVITMDADKLGALAVLLQQAGDGLGWKLVELRGVLDARLVGDPSSRRRYGQRLSHDTP